MHTDGIAFLSSFFFPVQVEWLNQIFVCYWRDPGAYLRFAQKSAFARWLAEDDLLTSDVGVWVEAFHIPMTRFETLFSSENPAGAARLTDKPMTGPIDEHGYASQVRFCLME